VSVKTAKCAIEIYKFKKGQKLHLDDIYMIQGLAGGKWWDAPDCASSDESDEEVTILEDIEIQITVTRR
jgi:hypothetical protein